MYFPIGWPKVIDVFGLGAQEIRKICCDRVKILFAVLTDDSLAIFYTNVSEHFFVVFYWLFVGSVYSTKLNKIGSFAQYFIQYNVQYIIAFVLFLALSLSLAHSFFGFVCTRCLFSI